MIKKLVLFFILIGLSVQAQHTVTGTIDNSKKETWVILYKVQGADLSFVQNANIENGKFVFHLKKGSSSGIYRVLYRLDKNSYLDFIYNNEDVAFSFDPNNPSSSVKFTQSDENRMYQKYSETIAEPQSKLDSIQLAYFQTNDATKEAKIREAYGRQLKAVNAVQQQFETLSKSMLTYHFIKASKRYNAAVPFKDPSAYLAAIKEHFFDAIDFNNPIILNSTLIIDRVNDYVYYVNVSQNKKTQENLYKKSINDVFSKINNPQLHKSMVYYLLKRFSDEDNRAISEFLISNYFDKLPTAEQDVAFKNGILSKMRVALHSKAPNITWTDHGVAKSLYGLKGAKYYFVLFWSSTCSHCLHEVPLLYDYIKDKKDIQVVAVGLENKPEPWKTEMKKYPTFIHVFGENHWTNKFAKAYDIHATPTYIILDANKNIIAKPYSLDDVKTFINKLEM